MSTWHVNGKNAVTVVSAVFLAIISWNPVHADSLRPLSQYVIVQAAIDGVLAAAGGFPDCNGNGIDDAQDIADLTSPDCNGNGVPDECEINENSIAPGGPFFCTDQCDADCNRTGVPDACELAGNDCNGDGRPDECGVFVTCDSTEDQKLTASDGAAFDLFGASVSISGDTALVGAQRDVCGAASKCGAAYGYRFDGTNWIEQQKLTASDASLGARFGISVSISGDTALVGAFRNDCADGFDCGSAYVYRFDGTNWIEEQKLTASDAAAFDEFGASVSISGDTALVGAGGADCAAGDNCGAVYVYRFDGTNWIEQQKLTASDAAAFDDFGRTVATSGDTVVIGARFADCVAGGSCGAAYVYRFDGTDWIEEQKLTPSDAAAGDFFGESVSISGDTVVVGSRWVDCAAGADCGAAYMYRFDGTNWIEEQKLTASDAAQGDRFGTAVAVNDVTAAIGAVLDDCSAGADCGAVYVYRFDGTNWIEEHKLTASDAEQADEFGMSVSISGGRVLVGADGDDRASCFACGAAYSFDLSGGEDCNCNSVADRCDSDCNGNGIPDDCEGLPDHDGDSVPDECDVCQGGDDTIDGDGDGIPDDCDICPNGSDTDDSDGDGVFDGCDICPGGDDGVDSDGDGVPDGCDACPGSDDSIDADGDGVPDACDICPGGDDTIDSDGDAIPDDCDVCPNGSNTVDSDGDGVFDGCDVCPGADDTIDSDADGVPDGCDLCAGADDGVDSDGDGVPDGCDVCDGPDDTIDSDSDGVPDCAEAILSPTIPASPHNIRKNRYISIDPRGAGGFNEGKNFDIRLTLTETLVNGVTVVGSQWWANEPDAACISIVGPTQPATPLNWDACPTLHLTGCPIMPTSLYEIVAVLPDGLESFPPFEAETQLKPADNKWWGDAVGVFDGTGWTAPQGVTNWDDTTAVIKTFIDPNAINAVHVSIADMHPNRPDLGGTSAQINKLVNIDDCFQVSRAFQGWEYEGGAIHLCPDP